MLQRAVFLTRPCRSWKGTNRNVQRSWYREWYSKEIGGPSGSGLASYPPLGQTIKFVVIFHSELVSKCNGMWVSDWPPRAAGHNGWTTPTRYGFHGLSVIYVHGKRARIWYYLPRPCTLGDFFFYKVHPSLLKANGLNFQASRYYLRIPTYLLPIQFEFTNTPPINFSIPKSTRCATSRTPNSVVDARSRRIPPYVVGFTTICRSAWTAPSPWTYWYQGLAESRIARIRDCNCMSAVFCHCFSPYN